MSTSPRIIVAATISFQCKGKMKSLMDRQQLREFRDLKPVLQDVFKDLL